MIRAERLTATLDGDFVIGMRLNKPLLVHRTVSERAALGFDDRPDW